MSKIESMYIREIVEVIPSDWSEYKYLFRYKDCEGQIQPGQGYITSDRVDDDIINRIEMFIGNSIMSVPLSEQPSPCDCGLNMIMTVGCQCGGV